MYPQDATVDHGSGRVVQFPDVRDSKRVASVPSTFVRLGHHELPPVVMDQLVEGHLTILAGGAGSGKTTLVEQVMRHVASGHQLGRFPMPDEPITVWAWFLEDTPGMTQERSLRVASRGALEEDSTHITNVRYFYERGCGLPSLRAELDAAAAGEDDLRPPQLVIVDFLRLLIGVQPSGISVNDWERKNLQGIRDLGKEYGCTFLVLTHTNKSGSVSGTAELANNCDTLLVIEPNGEEEEHAKLRALKMRLSPKADYALTKKLNGTWGFDDEMCAAEAGAVGVRKDILAVLRIEGPRTLSELSTHHAVDAPLKTIKGTLTRMRKDGEVRNHRGHWELVPGDGDRNLTPDPDGTDDRPVCAGCGHWMTYDDGSGYHVGCDPRTRPQPAPVPAPRPAEDVDQEHDQEPGDDGYEELETPEFRKAVGKLLESVKASRQHPLPSVKKDYRGDAPWCHISEQMSGEPRARAWRRDAPEGRMVAVLDRNGSYVSALSSVAVAPNRLREGGPLGMDPAARKGKAGIFLIPVPEWTDDRIGHPLGRTAEREGPIWVTAPHLEFLDKLAAAGAIDAVDVLDSWTGKRQTNLFERYGKWARDVREETAGTDDAVEAKRAYSRPIRMLWPKSDRALARSPFWRPDWHQSILAEASVRHWAKAYSAVQAGAELLSLENVDAAAFLVPEDVDDPAGWVPDGYTLGSGFGQIKHKDDVVMGRGQDKASSPLTAEQWNGRGRRG